MSDDPLKYLAAQIQEGEVAQKSKAKHQPQPDQNIDSTTGVTHQFLDVQEDSATPSEASHRGTITATDYSTPLTSAGLTPGETARRHSDAARKSITSTKKPGSSLRNEAVPKAKSRSTSRPGGHKSLEATNPSVEVETLKQTLRLVTDSSSRPETSNIKAMDKPRPTRFSAPDLNKSLPPPPPPESPTFDDQKQPHISRLMKTIRKKKSLTMDSTSPSTSSTPPVLPSADRAETTAKSKPHPSKAPVTPLATQPPSKRKFRIRLFGKRQQPQDVLVS